MCRPATGFGNIAGSTGSLCFRRRIGPTLRSGRSGQAIGKSEVEGVYSHQTAISLFNLSDLNPAKLHMTVPRSFRRNSEIPGILVLHYADLPASDVQTGPGYKYTRPLRTILDLIESGEVERNFIRQALTQAVDRGMITRQQIRNAQLTEPTRKVIEAILRQADLDGTSHLVGRLRLHNRKRVESANRSRPSSVMPVPAAFQIVPGQPADPPVAS
jgi:hypothetical protein